jgi:hypothetical protein
VPRRTITALAATAAVLAVPGVAGAHTKLNGGETTLRLNAATAKALTANGVKVAPVKPAKATKSGAIAFPITRGEVTLPKKGYIAHSGGLKLSAGKKSLVVRNFVIRLGKHPYLSAKAGKARVRLLDLSLAKAKLGRSGVAYTVANVKATLSRPAAKALNATLSTTLFKKGIPIGTARVRALPKTLKIAGGSTSLALDPGAAAALTSQGIVPSPIAPAKATKSGALSFPITGGALDRKTLAGRITHSGGIRLSKGSTVVDLKRFTIRIKQQPDLTAAVGSSRLAILNLDLSKAKIAAKGRRLRVSGVVARLTKGAADALNQAFGTSAFSEGLKLGTATVAARVK